MVEANAHTAINDVLCRFFLSFDQRDWTAMAECLSSDVFIDYSSSGREQPGFMSGTAFVHRRKNAFDTLAKHHSFSNLLLSEEGEQIRARCNYLILRFDKKGAGEGDDFYHSCGAYEFLLGVSDDQWKIASITQRTLRSWGNKQLHGGSRKTQPDAASDISSTKALTSQAAGSSAGEPDAP